MLRKTLADGELVVRDGDDAEAAWRVVSGTLRVRGTGPDGRIEETVADAGDVIGAVAVLGGERHNQTARAEGAVVVEMLPRAELVRLLAASTDDAGRLLGTLFAAASRLNGAPGDEATGGGRGCPAATEARLYGVEPALAGLLGPVGIGLAPLPFTVGRKESDSDDGSLRGLQLALADTRPYHLSRRHFAIERNSQGWLARDCGSFHGTYVNGLLVGASEPVRAARLAPGDNEIIAGALHSPFRFRLSIPA